MSHSAQSSASPRSPVDRDQTSVAGKLISWKSVGATAVTLGTPTGIGVLHPVLGEAAACIELLVMLAVLGTALFGAKQYSDRAFRLLRWTANRPEPESPRISSNPGQDHQEHARSVHTRLVTSEDGLEFEDSAPAIPPNTSRGRYRRHG
jgi:hypothetical protein